jgi:hypothetical protein
VRGGTGGGQFPGVVIVLVLGGGQLVTPPGWLGHVVGGGQDPGEVLMNRQQRSVVELVGRQTLSAW